MTVQAIFYLILALFIFEYILNTVLSYLNTRHWNFELPDDLKEIYDQTQYSKSMKYEKSKYDFSLISSAFTFFIMYFVLVFG
jgi:STE24 endopeptidase